MQKSDKPLIQVTKPIPVRRHYAGKVAGCLFVAIVLLVFAGFLDPFSKSLTIRGEQTKSLAQAKQIGLALILFASDHEGNYSRAGVPKLMTKEPANANLAFACLFPEYTQSESIFGNRQSAYQTRRPDNIIDAPYTGEPHKTLEAGENVYGYMMGLTSESNPAAPLVVEGSDGTGHYNTVPRVRGGVWGAAKHAVLIHLDNSAALTQLRGPDNSLYIPRADDPGYNALDPSYLGTGTRFLDPAIAGQ